METKRQIEELGLFNLVFEGGSIDDEIEQRMQIIQQSPVYSQELYDMIVEDGILYQLEDLPHAHDKWVAVDGSNSFQPRKMTLDVYFDVAAAAILNSEQFSFGSLDFYRGIPYRISRSEFYPRFPQLIRDCAEYKAINTISQSLDVDVIFADGSILGGTNWWARRYEGRNEEGSLTVNRSAFVEVIETDLVVLYDDLLNIASQLPILFFPKSSMSRGLIRNYMPELLEQEDMGQVSDIYLLATKLQQGEYILPEFTLNAMMSDVGTISKYRSQMDEFMSIIFQAGNPRYCLPIRFEIHQNWLDRLPQLLNLIEELYDNKMQMLGPLIRADELAGRLTSNSLTDAIEHELMKRCLAQCETEEEKIRLVKLFNPYRYDR